MTSQKKDPSSQENEKSEYPAKILTNLTVEDLKNYLIKKWSKADFNFVIEQLAETTAQNYSLVSKVDSQDLQIEELQTGYTALAEANLNRKKEVVSITFEQKRIHEEYEKKFQDLVDRIAAAGL